MFKLLAGKIARDIVQNHKDAPKLWEVSYGDLSNLQHKLKVSFNSYSFGRVSTIEINNHSVTSRVNCIGKWYLAKYFRNYYVTSNINIPTAKTSPESFI